MFEGALTGEAFSTILVIKFFEIFAIPYLETSFLDIVPNKI